MVISLLPSSAAVCFVEEAGYHERQDLALEASEERSVSATQPSPLFSAALRDLARLQRPEKLLIIKGLQQKLNGSRLHGTNRGLAHLRVPCQRQSPSRDKDNRRCITSGKLPLKVQTTHARQLQIQYQTCGRVWLLEFQILCGGGEDLNTKPHR